MLATTESAELPKEKAANGPVYLRTREEVRTYLAAHLKPVRFGPKGQPIYSHEDIEKLNVILYPHL